MVGNHHQLIQRIILATHLSVFTEIWDLAVNRDQKAVSRWMEQSR